MPSSGEESGLDVILSIGEAEENEIGTNCGQAAATVCIPCDDLLLP